MPGVRGAPAGFGVRARTTARAERASAAGPGSVRGAALARFPALRGAPLRPSTSSFCSDSSSLFTRKTPLRSLKLQVRVATCVGASQPARQAQKRCVAASNGARSQNPIQLLISPSFG
jgi:hypothetical protein